eukprot:TRINITY_DN58336_c0_g1_i2.p2 TRINITY_DN58336_c0_g1~~TRINITY_DN58336_c0_g1_i2.p2  ORF type:complete len:140 (-),score=6.11 TRINITY_DN58336_c0_g1_i2:729-1148(-)
MTLANWMSKVPGVADKLLVELSIPGSHDSATCEFPFSTGLFVSWGKCQEMTVGEQLRTGIRYFDLRIKDMKNDKVNCRPSRIAGMFRPDRKFWKLEDPERLWVSHTLLCKPLKDVVDEFAIFMLDDQETDISGEVVGKS